MKKFFDFMLESALLGGLVTTSSFLIWHTVPHLILSWIGISIAVGLVARLVIEAIYTFGGNENDQ